MSRVQYHPLTVLDVIEETADARSIVFEVPAELRDTFAYKPGQHLQLHVPCAENALPRCYSCSSTGALNEPLRVTVKRVAGGRASNWLCGSLQRGGTLHVAAPAGVFTPKSFDGDFLLYAGGSGITPVYSILRTALATGRGRVRLVYANRDEASIIFRAELEKLVRETPGRLEVIHWLDSKNGFATQMQLGVYTSGFEQAEAFICGPGPFMDAAQTALHNLGFPHARVHVERFVSLPEDVDDEMPATLGSGPAYELEAELDGTVHRVQGQPGELLLDALERAGVPAPYSCRAGACAACMCQLVDGDVEMIHNHVLTDADMQANWMLACQSVATSPKVRVKYPS